MKITFDNKRLGLCCLTWWEWLIDEDYFRQSCSAQQRFRRWVGMINWWRLLSTFIPVCPDLSGRPWEWLIDEDYFRHCLVANKCCGYVVGMINWWRLLSTHLNRVHNMGLVWEWLIDEDYFRPSKFPMWIVSA